MIIGRNEFLMTVIVVDDVTIKIIGGVLLVVVTGERERDKCGDFFWKCISIDITIFRPSYTKMWCLEGTTAITQGGPLRFWTEFSLHQLEMTKIKSR